MSKRLNSPGKFPDLDALGSLFHADRSEVGSFEPVGADQMPATYRTLLAHQEHMTVAVENFHGGLVDVQVLRTKLIGDRYAREILLCRQSDRAVVQYGIMRIHLACVDDEVRRAIVSQQTPLGRILIEHNVLREVHLSRLWRVIAGRDLQTLFGVTPTAVTFGRTAMIDFDGEPAVELLEIVVPVDGDQR